MQSKPFKKELLNEIYYKIQKDGKYTFQSDREIKNFLVISRAKGLPIYSKRGLTLFRDKEDAKAFIGPKSPIIKSLIERLKTGEKLTRNQIINDYFDFSKKYSANHLIFFVPRLISNCRIYLKREGLFVGLVDGYYQILQEETYQPDSYRRYKDLQVRMMNVQEQIMHGIEIYSGNPELVNQLELLILNLSDAVNNERRKLLTVKMNNEQS